MASYLGYVCLNIDNMPDNVSTATHVRVRIPQLHGHPDNDHNHTYIPDDQLPFASVLRPFGVTDFSAIDAFEEGAVVSVDLLNNDLNNLMIVGGMSNFTYTNDAAEIENRRNDPTGSMGSFKSTVDISKSVVSMAKNELYSKTKLTDGGTNTIKYNDWFYSVEEGSGKGNKQDWNTTFLCYVFHKSGNATYFNNGIKTNNINILLNYHKSANEQVKDGAKGVQAGDILFCSVGSSKTPTKVDLAISAYDDTTKTVKCISGGVQLSETDKSGVVNEISRNASNIITVIRPGTAICTNRLDPQWKQYDERWGNASLGGYKSVRQVGCAMTSIAILMRMTGLTKQDFNPGVLNNYLSTNGGYTNGNIYWGAPNNYVDGWAYVGSGTLSGSQKDRYNTLKKLMEDGYYVIVRVGKNGTPRHFVAAVGYTSTDILKSDPARTETSLFGCSYYNSTHAYQYFKCSVPFKCI